LETCVDETIQKPSDTEKSRSCLIECINSNTYRETGDLPDFRERLLQEAEQFIVAGTETTGYALSVTTFYILQNAEIQKKLRQELVDAQISLNEHLDITSLQNLRYLVSPSPLGNRIIWKRGLAVARS
jgi:cytochrome P450